MPSASAKYFIAIIPPEPLFSEIEALKFDVSQNYNTRGSLRSPAHITLHMPFEWKAEKEDELISRLEAFRFEKNFAVELKNFSCFAPRVLFIDVVSNKTLDELQKQLVQHMKQRLNIFNEAESQRPYHSHMTIAFRDLRKPEFHKAWEEYRNKTFSAVFPVNAFTLLKHDGKKWNVLKAFMLQL